MGALLALAFAFFLLWLVLVAIVKVTGFAVHLLLFAAALAAIAWTARKFAAHTTRPPSARP